MSNLKHTRMINSQIAQFKNLCEYKIKSTVLDCIDGFIERIDSIDNKVTPTEYIESRCYNWLGCTLLHFAVIKEKRDIFFYLLNKGADFTIKNNDGDTALHLAFKDNIFKDSNDVSVVMEHLKKSNLVNICDEYGFSYFHMACMANDVALVQQFLANGVSVDHAIASESLFFPGFTPIHFAVKCCAFEVAEVLLFHSANRHAKDSRQMTPLHVLLENKFYSFSLSEKKILGSSDGIVMGKIKKIIGLLFENYNNEMLIIDEIGLSNLHVACAIGDLSTAENIIKNNIDVNHCVYKNAHLWQGYTALHFAIQFNMEAVILLLTNGADIEVKDAKGFTAFDLCLEELQLKRMEIIFHILLLHPVWKNVVLSDERIKLLDIIPAMKTPVELQIFLNQLDEHQIFKYSVYIPSNSPLWPGFSLMHLAIAIFENIQGEDLNGTSFDDTLRILLNHDLALLHKPEIHGWTPLHLAYRLNKQNIVDILLRYHRSFNSPTNFVDEDGLSHMHIACAKNDGDFLEKLLLHNSNVNVVFRGKSIVSSTIHPQSTPLHVAVTNGSDEMVKMLLKHGADVNAKNANDMTPIHMSIISIKYEDNSRVLLSSSNLKESVVNGIGLSHLHVASYCGDLMAMEKLVGDGANVNQTIENINVLNDLSMYKGYTPLAFAIRCNDKVATWLVERGADIFVKMPNGNSLLIEMIDNYFYNILTMPCIYENILLQNRARMDIGLTTLHVACYNNNVRYATDLLNNGADVNAKIYETWPSWSGFTPLHAVSVAIGNNGGDFDEIIQLLSHKGADVTLANDKSETPLHQVYIELLYEESDEQLFSYANQLLEAQRDFSVNPANIEGITHFHVACSLCNIAVMKEFLKHGIVNVNQPIDDFSDRWESGRTPLLLACDSEMRINKIQRLQAAKLLLEHGADANIVDSRGNVILHDCINPKFFDLFELLIRHGADANFRNWDGKTPLQCLISKKDFSVEDVKTLLRFGCRFNMYNTSTEVGYIGLVLKSISHTAMDRLISALIVNFSHLIEADDMNRTVIHNIVSVQQFDIQGEIYAEFIELLMSTGCDIDDQDKAGRTALHLAAKFRNFAAISTLLMLGADINVTDFSGKTAFTCDLALCNRRGGNDDQDGDNEDVDNDCNNGLCEHFLMFKTFAVHVKKLQLCGIDVHQLNENLASEAYRKFHYENALSESFFKELDEIKNMKIGLHSLSLSNFLSENKALVRYPTMSVLKRQAINKFFSRAQARGFREKFSETAGILQLQYRKAVARLQLVEDGRNALMVLMGFTLPDMIYQMILEFLKNSDLKMLILAADIITQSSEMEIS